ncbi:hypothetical protein [Ectobacillus ponti]|uniref:Uncharacterized protein n=1 Tax=Ectobacillus ponti TaxID=2961894 RepID=A0AA41X5X9_9BACI|nr:hypothetical protein [Ectobacillus ponti]MCP8969539.1 hypothetical protein [Ectobacillus ponti]
MGGGWILRWDERDRAIVKGHLLTCEKWYIEMIGGIFLEYLQQGHYLARNWDQCDRDYLHTQQFHRDSADTARKHLLRLIGKME